MSYKDKRFGFILPTRTGVATGASNERQMLDRLGGSAGYRKNFVTAPDGSVTMCMTKNGMPQFTTVTNTVIPVTDHVVYLESGQLEWSYPAPESPWRLDPAVWRFMDIPTTRTFLGYSDKTGTQHGSVSEGQDSEAVGYPKAVVSSTITLAQAAVLDAQARIDNEALALLRKQTTGTYTPSLFSGKMRLFIQAQYGARTGDMPWPFYLMLMEGVPPAVFFATGGMLEIGFSADKSLGIYTAPDQTYWLLHVSMSGSSVFVTYYPIYHDARVADFVTALKATPSTELEAYVFAYSTIDLAHPTTIVCAGAPGDAMAYGWKFNTAGDKASIVVHNVIGSGSTTRWSAQTVHLTFSYSLGIIAVDSTVSAAKEWVDGWGTYNFFVPYDTLSPAPLLHWSLLTGTPAYRFNYSDVPIYGYYKDDVWTDVKVTATAMTGFPIYTYSEIGVTHDDGYVLTTSRGQYYSGVQPANGSSSASYSEISSGDTAVISIGGHEFNGFFHYGYHQYHSKICSAGGISGVNPSVPDSFVDTPVFVPSTVNGYLGAVGWRGDGSDNVVGAIVNTKDTTWTGAKSRKWTFIIPCGDCEAAIVTAQDGSSGTYSNIWTIDGGVSMFTGLDYAWSPWTGCGSTNNSWYGVWGVSFSSGTNGEGPPVSPMEVTCFSSAIADSGLPGAPGGSYETLFTVDSTYPYYARGIQTYSSYGKRYRGSDIGPSPSSVTSGVFVGWA